MSTTPAGIAEADWLATPAAVRVFILAQQQEIEQLRSQLTALATELAGLRERIGRKLAQLLKAPIQRRAWVYEFAEKPGLRENGPTAQSRCEVTGSAAAP